MKLTPLEIRKQEFRRTMRGFDPVEVQTFLDMVAEQYEQLVDENNALNRRVIELETKLQDYQESEKTLRETLVNFQEVKKQSEESSRRQADIITKEAELKALEILETARKDSRQIQEEINWLKSQKDSFINRLRHILTSQIELLSVMEIDDLLPESASAATKGSRRRSNKTSAGADSADNSNDKESESTNSESRVIERHTTPDSGQTPIQPKKIQANSTQQSVDNEAANLQNDDGADINDFFKDNLEIDDLIKSISKKDTK